MGRKNLRIALAELCKTGKKTANIAKIDKPASVCKTVERFIETGESENHPRNGRPTTLFTPENIQKSLGQIQCNPQLTICKMAREDRDK
ncbi:hypothetical protein KIN20_000354 [Parelaphostrongylus tenuis]|uniref:Uncharacterized protein n=1 Tax=Parelaphostrongylus tenuis TaxID=148309 RepID=A0AAD5MDH7_PARTN|nr:hypothetical protein KIN20_000354 [Parelaphostrongylus tenuis]